MKVVRIDWIDSKAAPNKWEHLDGLESLDPVICTSVGILVEEAATYVTIAHSISDTQICGRITIPKVSITKRRRLK